LLLTSFYFSEHPMITLILFILGVALLAARSIITRALDRPFAVAIAATTLISIGIVQLARTDQWAHLVAWMIN